LITTAVIPVEGGIHQVDAEEVLATYRDALLTRLSGPDAPRDLSRRLHGAFQAMRENLDPQRTLQEVFSDCLEGGALSLGGGLKRADDEIQANGLDPSPQPSAHQAQVAQLPKEARLAGFEVVLAASPLLPEALSRRRLEHAGLGGNSGHTYIGSRETLHFSEPHPERLVELLGLLGRTAAEIVIFSSDVAGDLEPARTLGIHTFHLGSERSNGHPGGSTSDAVIWLHELQAEPEIAPSADPRAVLARLRGHLAALLGLTRALDVKQWKLRPEPDAWAPVEIVCHLRDVELEVNLPRYWALLTEERPFVSAVESDHWAAERAYIEQAPDEALAAFARARRESLSILGSIRAIEWQRQARHALLGPTSLAELGGVSADHDRIHLAQLRSAIGVFTPL